ncbi:MAG: hypothetical protein ACREEQ_14715, partial [Caulobacteraceae bacterium]
GEALAARAGAEVGFTVRIVGAAGARLDIIMDGRHDAALAGAAIDTDDATLAFTLTSDGARHWIRADVRSPDGARTLMIGNPIYLKG